MDNQTLLTLGVAVAVTLSIFSVLTKNAKAEVRPNRYGRDHRINPYFVVGDFLVSRVFPKIRDYTLGDSEIINLTRLATRLVPLVVTYGTPRILSGGRPKSIGDWYAALKAEGLNPARNSQHAFFAAADLTFGTPALDKTVYDDVVKNAGSFLQAILYKQKNGETFIHLSVPNQEMPKVAYLRKIVTMT